MIKPLHVRRKGQSSLKGVIQRRTNNSKAHTSVQKPESCRCRDVDRQLAGTPGLGQAQYS